VPPTYNSYTSHLSVYERWWRSHGIYRTIRITFVCTRGGTALAAGSRALPLAYGRCYVLFLITVYFRDMRERATSLL